MKRSIIVILISLFAVISATSTLNAAVMNEGRYYKYLKSVYDQKNTKLNEYLITECKKFLELYDSGPMAAEVRYVLGLLYLEEKDYSLAVAAFLKGLFLDPVSERMNDERQQIKSIIREHRHFKDMVGKIDKSTEGPFIDKVQSGQHYDYLRALYDINDPDLYRYMINESKKFTVKYPDSDKIEDVLQRLASLYLAYKDYYKAISTYEKIAGFFPSSANIPSNDLMIAKIRYLKLKNYENARDEFSEVTKKHGKLDVAGDAYFYLGELNQEEFENLPAAIKNYQAVAFNYVINPYAVESLFRVADIYENELKDYDKAIESLSKIGRDFSSDDRAPEAYDKIAEIYIDEMKDYDSAITTYKKLAEVYPQSPIAADRLYEAARIAERKLKDYGNAISLYEDVRGMFPSTKEAKRSERRISKLKRKIKRQ